MRQPGAFGRVEAEIHRLRTPAANMQLEELNCPTPTKRTIEIFRLLACLLACLPACLLRCCGIGTKAFTPSAPDANACPCVASSESGSDTPHTDEPTRPQNVLDFSGAL